MFVVRTGRKTTILQRLWREYVINFCKKCKKSKLQKYNVHRIIKQSMRTTLLKLFKAFLQDQVIDSNKEIFQ